ncbi:probable receptor-like protein kinase At1g49730 isoform X1 [Daucus carota subsp. sativus]|uniref:probable receptor-like protein kinase At1g49730 isoform X1 n=2 Tax=Daucus carota subsp. sativus TaxID=79200 RepID=UPI0007EFEDE9|nr:PREDICTED: probable receptor-like protein kinase At1g49730 isoform X1 [Daucus carota subsp. sativus]
MMQNWTFQFGFTDVIVNELIILIIILNIVVYKFRQRQEAELVEQNNRLLLLSTQGLCCRFSLHQMQRATSNFLDELIIGKGGFGKVYKGTFEPGPTVVAIKRLQSMSSQGSTEFKTEIDMLSKIRHSHLVSLIGYCDDGKEMILVYEYMRGGSLADHLHKRVRQGYKSLPTLSWVQRLKICIGAARGLEYLHTGTGIQQRVIHRDVKTTNILLDENLAAKISDFGLSKLSPANQATTYVSTRVKGTPGYLDPHYFLTHRLTRKSDVYSFGIVLLEVLCGRPAVDRSLDKEQIGLAGWAEHCFREGLMTQIIDAGIKGEVFPDSLEVFVKVAIQCLHIGPKRRPTIAEVVVYLESALALQEKSTEYHLAEVITSDYFQEDIEFSKPEVENENSEEGVVGVLNRVHPKKQSSGRITYIKRIGVFVSLKAQALSVRRHVKTSNSNSILSVPANLKKIKSTDLATMSATTNLKIFKLIDLIKATSNFEEVLGKGGSIDVFKGWVHEKSYDPSTPDIGLPVAVKRFIPEREPGHKKWQMELDLSREYSHPNFVKLVGYCCEAQEHLLVYEYMQNSGLDTHIFKSASQTMKTARIALPLQARLKIIMGAARCLAFLHTSEQSVIYGDFKTSRILLDGKFIAKLSPQGLTRLAPSDSNTERYDGALHDAASESSKPCDLSLKTDVYAFGMVLLELMTGIQANSKEELLLDHANFLDTTYLDPWLEDSFPGPLLRTLTSLITGCIDNDPNERPSMLQVVENLEIISNSCEKYFKNVQIQV